MLKSDLAIHGQQLRLTLISM